MQDTSSPKKNISDSGRHKVRAEALRKNLLKRKQQVRGRLTEIVSESLPTDLTFPLSETEDEKKTKDT